MGGDMISSIPGERFTFHVKGDSLRCSNPMCPHEVKRKVGGMECPKCGEGILEPVSYEIQLDAFDGNGECDCDHFQMYIKPLLKQGHKGTTLRCKHLQRLVDDIIRGWVRGAKDET
jgi:hypothetical protein